MPSKFLTAFILSLFMALSPVDGFSSNPISDEIQSSSAPSYWSLPKLFVTSLFEPFIDIYNQDPVETACEAVASTIIWARDLSNPAEAALFVASLCAPEGSVQTALSVFSTGRCGLSAVKGALEISKSLDSKGILNNAVRYGGPLMAIYAAGSMTAAAAMGVGPQSLSKDETLTKIVKLRECLNNGGAFESCAEHSHKMSIKVIQSPLVRLITDTDCALSPKGTLKFVSLEPSKDWRNFLKCDDCYFNCLLRSWWEEFYGGNLLPLNPYSNPEFREDL